MPVDPSFVPLLDAVAELAVDGPRSVEETRAAGALLAALQTDAEDVAEVVDATVPGPAGPVPIRRYVPAAADLGEPRPVLVWYHGGGWVMGDLEIADATCRRLANRTGAIVVSVDYRLAPEHPFPAGLDDCVAALDAVVADAASFGGDPRRLAVGGDSAGGNLAAVVAVHARDRGGLALRHQLLVYPVTDATFSFPSIDENAEGYLLTRDHMFWFTDHYLGADREHGDPKDPRVSPIFVDDASRVAPATVITAEFDPLRDEGEAYADLLRTAGVDVTCRRTDGAVHAFFGMTAVTPLADDAMDLAAARLRAALA